MKGTFYEPIFLEPVFKERIWGGTKLKDLFGYDIPYPNTGECWAVSAHTNGQSIVKNGAYQGTTLGDLWTRNRELFCDPPMESDHPFPLLIKILDASDDLSVQVHPDDEYAASRENGELGKTECWYVVDCEQDAEIIFGHQAETKEQLADLIHGADWDSLLTRVKVKPGDFFYVPSGTLHALGKGIVVLETQQSSDTTYRVYDYDRIAADGKKRELHLEKAMEVLTVPHRQTELVFDTVAQGDFQRVTYISNDFFTVQKWSVSGAVELDGTERFLIISVIGGTGMLECANVSYPLQKGEHFILPQNFCNYRIIGDLECIVSHK